MGASSSYDLGNLDDGLAAHDLDTFADDGTGSVLVPYGAAA